MSRTSFYANERETFTRLRLLRSCVTDQPLYDEPCILLANQLNELEVFTARLLQEIRAMRAINAKAADLKERP